MINPKIRHVANSDWKSITEIFNYFVRESFAAYPDNPVENSAFRDRHMANPEFPFVVAELDNTVVGFGFLSPFHAATTMRHSATLTYFLHPDHLGRGIGSILLKNLIDAGVRLGITNFLAHISSLNSGSIRFHAKNGFTECGRLVNVGVKNGRPFDMVWMQRQQS